LTAEKLKPLINYSRYSIYKDVLLKVRAAGSMDKIFYMSFSENIQFTPNDTDICLRICPVKLIKTFTAKIKTKSGHEHLKELHLFMLSRIAYDV
jgi:hypothetical protein